MAKYQYKGRSKIITQIPSQKTVKLNTIVDTCNFVILAAYPMAGIKKLGCALVNDYYNEEVVNLHLDLIKSVCKSPNIIVVGGFDIKKVLKSSRRNEFQVVENTLHEFTNSSEDLRLGLNAAPTGPSVVLDGSFLPSIETYRLLLEDQSNSKICFSVRKTEVIGINTSAENTVNYFGYSCDKKIKGAYYLNTLDFNRIRKKCVGSSFNKTQFDFEVIEELRLLAIEDNSKSLRLDENHDFKD